jgi:hypothetical protein
LPTYRELATFFGCYAAALVLGFGLTICVGLYKAHDDPWYKAQRINPAAHERLNIWNLTSCCDKGDHFDTRFRLVEDGSKYGAETYEYWTGSAWKIIPADISP